MVLLLFFQATTTNYLLLCMTLGDERQSRGVLFEKELVDHQADLERKFHEGKGHILKRLQRLELGVFGSTLAFRGLRRARSVMVRLWKLVLDLPLDE